MPAVPTIPYVAPGRPQPSGPTQVTPLRPPAPGKVVGPGKPFLPVEHYDEGTGRLYKALRCPRCGTNAGTATDGCVACGYGSADKWTKFSDELFESGY